MTPAQLSWLIRFERRSGSFSAKARRWVRSLEPQWRFTFPTAEFDPATDTVIVAEAQRNRLQIYKKVRDYNDSQANL